MTSALGFRALPRVAFLVLCFLSPLALPSCEAYENKKPVSGRGGTSNHPQEAGLRESGEGRVKAHPGFVLHMLSLSCLPCAVIFFTVFSEL